MPYSARMKQPIRSFCAGLLAAMLWPLLAHAEFPDRTVKIVVPFDAGGSIDTVARALAQRLNDKWNVPVIVENRPGVSPLRAWLAQARSGKARPLSCASVGKGSAPRFCMELLKSEAGIPLLHVPYRGVAPAVVAVTRGEVDLFCSDITAALGLLQGDKVTPLAITSRKRAPALPDVAPFALLGLPNYHQTGYVRIMVTGGTPP